MSKIKTLTYPGFEAFKKDIAKYSQTILDGKVIAFRGANCSETEQQEVMKLLGDVFGWWPNSVDFEDPLYYATHHLAMDDANILDKTSTMLEWHLEHVWLTSQAYVGACWCMNIFKCEPGSGQTVFVDVVEVFNRLSGEDQDFLRGAVVTAIPCDPEDTSKKDLPPYEFMQKHWMSDLDVMRPVLDRSHNTQLVSLYGKTPTKDDEINFNRIHEHIVSEVTSNESLQHPHSWQEGDMLLLDVFRMAHSVRGGFKENERKLNGIFGIIYK